MKRKLTAKERQVMLFLALLLLPPLTWGLALHFGAGLLTKSWWHPTRVVAGLAWLCGAATAFSWIFGHRFHDHPLLRWLDFWSARAIGAFIAVTGWVTVITADGIMRGWKPGVSPVSVLVVAACVTIGWFMALATNRLVRHWLDEDFREELRDHHLASTWRGMEPCVWRPLEHDALMGIIQAALLDMGICLAIAALLYVFANGPLGTLHGDWVKKPIPLVQPVRRAAERPVLREGGIHVESGLHGPEYGDNN